MAKMTQEEINLRNKYNMSDKQVNLELIDYRLLELTRTINDMKGHIESNVVTRKEFDIRVGRVETILYSVIGIAGTSVVGAILSLILK